MSMTQPILYVNKQEGRKSTASRAQHRASWLERVLSIVPPKRISMHQLSWQLQMTKFTAIALLFLFFIPVYYFPMGHSPIVKFINILYIFAIEERRNTIFLSKKKSKLLPSRSGRARIKIYPRRI